MAQAAPAVEQPGDGMREQRAARRRPGDDLGHQLQIARDHVEQILGQPPDRRRMPEQLVRVQVDAAVEAVAVVEVPVGHQDPERLHVLAGALARDEVAVGHVSWWTASGRRERAWLQAWRHRSGDGHGGEGARPRHVRVGVDDAAADDGGGDAALAATSRRTACSSTSRRAAPRSMVTPRSGARIDDVGRLRRASARRRRRRGSAPGSPTAARRSASA